MNGKSLWNVYLLRISGGKYGFAVGKQILYKMVVDQILAKQMTAVFCRL